VKNRGDARKPYAIQSKSVSYSFACEGDGNRLET